MTRLILKSLLKKYGKILCSILIVSSLGCAVIIGLSGVVSSLRRSFDRFVEDFGYPDAIITTEITSKEEKLAKVLSVPGVKEAYARACADTVAMTGKGRILSVRAFSCREEDFERFHYWAQTETEEDSIYVEVGFAWNNDLCEGETLLVKAGTEYREFVIKGLISMPETLVSQPYADAWGAHTDFGFIFVPEQLLKKETEAFFEKHRKKIEEREKELQNNEAESADELEKRLEKLEEDRKKLEDERGRFEAVEEQILDTLLELERSRQKLTDAQKVFTEKKAEITAARETNLVKQQELSEAKEKALARKEELTQAGKAKEAQELAQDLLTIEKGLDALSDVIAQEDMLLTQIGLGEQEVESGLLKIDNWIALLEEWKKEGQEALSEAEKKIEEGETTLAQKELTDRTEFADTQNQIEKARANVDSFKGYEDLCNQFLIRVTDGADREEVLAAVKEALGDVSVSSSYTYETSPVKKWIDGGVEPFQAMADYMPVAFFVITLIVVFLFMSLMIRQSRREIGILRAVGASVNRIRGTYCLLNLVVSIGGVLLGTAIGYGLLCYAGTIFKNYHKLPAFIYLLKPQTVCLAAVSTIGCGQLATLFSTTVLAGYQPTEAMARPTPATHTMPRILAGLTGKAGPMVKFSAASLWRNKRRFVLSVICVSASVMMIFSSFTFVSSKNYLLKELFTDRIHYDCQIYFKTEPVESVFERLKKIEGVTDLQRQGFYIRKVTAGEKEESIMIYACDPATDLIGIYDQNHKKLRIPENGILLERHTAQRLGVKKGDTVMVGEVSLLVTDISDQSINRSAFVSETQGKALGKEDFGCLLACVGEEHEMELVSELTGEKGYLFTVFTRILREGSQRNYATYDTIAWLVVAFAIIIGLTIIINITQTNLLERKKELCVLRTLGFQNSTLALHWFFQTLLQLCFSYLIGFAVGERIARISLEALKSEDREYVYKNGPKEFLITFFLVLGFTLFSHILTVRTMKKWDLVESIKDKQ